MILLFLGEIALRFFSPINIYFMDTRGPMAKYTGWGPTLDKQGQFLCDNPHSPPGSNNTIRVLTIGDSLLDCNNTGTQPFKITIPYLLGKDLGKNWDVYNISAGGWGTDQQLLAYRTLGKTYKPHWVFLFYTPANDLFNNSTNKAIRENLSKPRFVIEEGKLILKQPLSIQRERSKLIRLALRTEIGKRLFLIHQAHGNNVDEKSLNQGTTVYPLSFLETEKYSHMAPSFKPLLPRFKRSWDVTKRILIQFKQEVEKEGGKFVIVYLPTGIRNLCDPLPDYPHNCIGYGSQKTIKVTCSGKSMLIAPYEQYNMLKKLGEKEGIPIIEVFKYFKKYANNHTSLAGDCLHFNHAKGAQFVVNGVIKYLQTKQTTSYVRTTY